jgi:uncharacterized membrane protein YkoI
MVSRILFALAAVSLLSSTASVEAQGRGRDRDQEAAYRAHKQGRIMSLREIEAKILPRARGAEYLGPELDAGRGVYRLKFMKDGRVVWVDVDAGTGQVLGRSGN